MIGLTLDLPSDQRVEGTVATTVSGYMKGCRFFRVHDVKENMRAMKMIEAICAKQGEQMMDQITIKDLEVMQIMVCIRRESTWAKISGICNFIA